MVNEMNADRVLNGTYGVVWINEQELGNIKKFEVKASAAYEDVQLAGNVGKSRKFMGYEITGSMTMNKIDSTIAKLVAESWKAGKSPDIKIVAKIEDPSAYGAERVILKGVTLDEFMLTSFEVKALTEEEIPFSAQDFEFLDMI